MTDIKVDDGKWRSQDLSVVIPFCSMEADLIDDVVRSAAAVSSDVVIVSCTHFFDGEPDTRAPEIVQRLKREYAQVRTVSVTWRKLPPNAPPGFWPCELRMHGFAATNPRTRWVLWLDADEVVREPERFSEWFQSVKDTKTTAFKLANYWYFLSKRRRAKQIEDSIVMVQRQYIHATMFRDFASERDAMTRGFGGPPRNVTGLDGKPMFDHFSWVRSPPTVLLDKVRNWGHKRDRNWKELVEKALSEDPLTTRDFVHNYEFDILP